MKRTISLLLMLFVVTKSWGLAEAKSLSCTMNFKEILVPSILGENYTDGPSRFPNYRYYGLPENFSIDERPVFIIKNEDIRVISVSKTDETRPINYIIHFNVSNRAVVDSIEKFTSQHIYGSLALEICNDIVWSARILEPLDEINIQITESELSSLMDKLKLVTSNEKIKYEK